MSKRNETYRRDFIKKNKGIFGIYFCYLCRRPLTRRGMQVDHIMPISKLGGSNKTWNLAPLCPKCNQRKSNKVDHRVAIGYGTKIINSLLTIPFVIAGMFMSLFFKLNFKLKLLVIALVVFWLYSNGII